MKCFPRYRLLCIFLAACRTLGGSPKAVETAVPTIATQFTPASQATPSPTIPTVTPAVIVSATNVPDFDPVSITEHSPTAPTRDPGAALYNLTYVRDTCKKDPLLGSIIHLRAMLLHMQKS